MEISEWLETIKNKPNHSADQDSTHPYGFVVGWKEGRGYVLGPYTSDEEVTSHTMEFEPDKFIIVWSRYRQQNQVTRGAKHDRLDSGDDLVQATTRMRHQFPGGIE